MNNPYLEFVQLIKEIPDKPDNFIKIGEVVSTSPLSIKVEKLALSDDDLYVSNFLISNFLIEFEIPSTRATGTAGEHNVSNIGIPNGKIKLKNILKTGDKVAGFYTKDQQQFIILTKVVRLND